MVVSDIDLRLLRVFRAVVESGGFSNAQATLNVSQSTISTQMSQLEARLGFTLCSRGRGGFSLTAEGQAIYQHTVALFDSLNNFQCQAAELREGLSGRLSIGFLDNIITDDECPLGKALRKFVEEPKNSVEIRLDVLAPEEIERGILDKTLDIGIGIFQHSLPGLEYTPLYRERDVLVCHRSHPLARIKDPRVLARAVGPARKVVRTFMGMEEFPFHNENDPMPAMVTSLEAAAFMILTGAYIGFLPGHYARQWCESGQMIALLPDKFMHFSQFSLVSRMQHGTVSGAVSAFLKCLFEVHDEKIGTKTRQEV